MFLNESDIILLSFFNDFKYSTSETIRDIFFNGLLSKDRNAQRKLKWLYDNNLLDRGRKKSNTSYVYWLTSLAAQYLRYSGIYTHKIMNHMNWPKWQHDQEIQRCMLEFVKSGVGNFISERKMITKTVLNKKIVPDLGVALADNYIIAVEIERTPKSKKRIFDKLNGLDRCSVFKSVLYISYLNSITENLKEAYSKLYNPSFNLIIKSNDDFFENPKGIISLIINESEGEY